MPFILICRRKRSSDHLHRHPARCMTSWSEASRLSQQPSSTQSHIHIPRPCHSTQYDKVPLHGRSLFAGHWFFWACCCCCFGYCYCWYSFVDDVCAVVIAIFILLCRFRFLINYIKQFFLKTLYVYCIGFQKQDWFLIILESSSRSVLISLNFQNK